MTRFCRNRFECIAHMLPVDLELLAEIGYDHGENLLRAAARLPGAQLIGVEKQAAAASRFTERHGHRPQAQRIELRHGLGLTPLHGAELASLLFTGLGERNICGILSADPERLALVHQVFCMPLQRAGRLLPFMREQGFLVDAEDTAIERGRYYPMTRFRRSR